MTRETVWETGIKLIERMSKDFVIQLRQVQGLVQNDYGFTQEQKKQAVADHLQYLKQLQTEINNDIEAYRQTIEQYGKS